MSSVRFLGGVVKEADVERLNAGGTPKVVFAGRSNVGKSSLLNALTGQKVARVSAEPGKTREMNFFEWYPTRSKHKRDAWVLVDLPGYGYAKVATELRKQWGKEITAWLTKDSDLCIVIALVDGRHGYLQNDVELVEFLKASGLNFVVAFTKMDKWKSRNQRLSAEKKLAKVSLDLGVVRYLFVSSTSKEGIRPIFEELRRERELLASK